MKYLKYLIISLLIIFPFNVKANNYGIENFYIDATVLDNGDLLVKEIFELNENYNGFERIINYKNDYAPSFNPNSSIFGGSQIHNGSDLELINIKGIKKPISFNSLYQNGDLFRLVNSADKGDYGVYMKIVKAMPIKCIIQVIKIKLFI